MKPLTPRRSRFVEEYLVDLDANAAARRAGYRIDPRSRYPHALLRMPQVAAAVREAMDARARRMSISADRVVTEIMAVAFSDIRNIVRWRTAEPSLRGRARLEVELRASADIDESSAAAIAYLGRGADGAARVRLHDKLAALTLLGRHLGMFGMGRGGVGAAGEPASPWPQFTPEQKARLRVLIREIAPGA